MPMPYTTLLLVAGLRCSAPCVESLAQLAHTHDWLAAAFGEEAVDGPGSKARWPGTCVHAPRAGRPGRQRGSGKGGARHAPPTASCRGSPAVSQPGTGEGPLPRRYAVPPSGGFFA